MIEILSEIFSLNILDSQPTLQRPNLSWQQDAMSDRKVWVEYSPQKETSENTLRPRIPVQSGTHVYSWVSLGCLFCLSVKKLQTFISGASKLQSSWAHSLSWPYTLQTTTTERNSLKYYCSQYLHHHTQFTERTDKLHTNNLQLVRI